MVQSRNTPNGWITYCNIDFTEVTSDSFSQDANELSNGLIWQKANTAAESEGAYTRITNGTGLIIEPNATTLFNDGTRTLPNLALPLTQILSTFDITMGVRVWVRYGTENSAAEGDMSVVSLNSANHTAFTLKRGYTGGNNIHGLNITKNNSTTASNSVTTLAADNCLMLEVDDLLNHRAKAYYGTFVTGWPASGLSTMPVLSSLQIANSSDRISDGTAGFTASNWQVMFGAERNGSATSLSVVFRGLRIDIKRY